MKNIYSPAMVYFHEVATAGSIRRAAERLAIAPSAVSRQISNLETALEVTLFDRQGQRLTLTPAGEVLAAFAQRSVVDAEAMQAALLQITNSSAGQVRLASVEGMVSYFLSRYLATFEKRHPGVKVAVSIVGSRAVLDLVKSGEVDLALAFGLPHRHSFRVHARVDQPLCVIVAPEHPLASRRSVSFKSLAGSRVVLPDATFQIRMLVDKIERTTMARLERVVETNSLEFAKGIVRNSGLMTFLPRYAALREIASGDLCAIPLQERELATTSVNLITLQSKTLSSVTLKLIELLKNGMTKYDAKAESD